MKVTRLPYLEYWEVTELPVGDVPYASIARGLKDEKYFRKFVPTYCRENLLQGHLSALLYWYPHYITLLYDLAVEGKDYMSYFNRMPSEITEAFFYLFPELIRKLDKIKDKSNVNHLGELSFSRSMKATE